jgi:molecular chaperone GrpE
MVFSEDMSSNDQKNEQAAQKTELDSCREAVTLAQEKYTYLLAEFENFKRRTEKDKASWSSAAQATLVTDLLPIIDDFERSFIELQSKQMPDELKAYFAGFELIMRAFQKFLKTHNIIEITDLKQFDPEKHEAIMQVDSPEHASGDIVTVFQKGYFHNKQILRPARVSVAK